MDASIELVKHLLLRVVHIHAVVAREHPSTKILGGDRLGSGLVVDASGLILTVNYVVMGAQTIEVAFAKGRRTRAEIVAQDFEVGLALLKVSLNAEEVASRRDLYMRLWRHEPGERLILEVMRENKVRRVEVLGGDRAYFFRQL